MVRKRRLRRRRPATTDRVQANDLSTLEDEDDAETGPLRRCVVTRERLPKEQMIRFVVGPDRQIVPDLAARLPGRGIWLSASLDVIQSGSAQEEKRVEGGRQNTQADGAI